ncbi:riboflavin kinase [Mucilaginibacter antarcticus]|uniref:riboflavin kinase n=1 Tax=Mucilaginibacter antarcticus TaxID=1855725 RepID=UPI003625E20F
MGYPTANIHVEERYKLIPGDGIFAVKVQHDNIEYKGMAYIGSRPTINGMTRNIEVNLFDFDKEIYGDTIRMEFLNFIRGDMKLNGLDELKAQIARDKEEVLKRLA